MPKIPDTVGEPTIPFYSPPLVDPKVFPILEHQWRNGVYTKGDNVAELEERLKEYLDVEHIVLTSSGTMAIAIGVLAAKSLGYPASNVYVPAYTWTSVPFALQLAGTEIVYRDIDNLRWHLDYSKVPVSAHLACVTETYGSRARKFTGARFFVDAAHSMGLPKIGARGLFEAFSLAATKVVTGGEGGIISTSDKKLADNARSIARFVGRLPEASAILALSYLNDIDAVLRWRKAIFDEYRRLLGSNVIYQDTSEGTNHYVIPVRLNSVQLKRLCKPRDFAVRQYYNPPLDTFCKNALDVSETVVCLPQVNIGICQHVADVILGKV